MCLRALLWRKTNSMFVVVCARLDENDIERAERQDTIGVWTHIMVVWRFPVYNPNPNEHDTLRTHVFFVFGSQSLKIAIHFRNAVFNVQNLPWSSNGERSNHAAYTSSHCINLPNILMSCEEWSRLVLWTLSCYNFVIDRSLIYPC